MNDPVNQSWQRDTMPKVLTAIARTRVPGFKMRIMRKTEESLDLLNEDIAYLLKQCDENKGKFSQKTGDGIEVRFSCATQAVEWALSIQKHFTNREKNGIRDYLKHAIGIHIQDNKSDQPESLEETKKITEELCNKAVAGTIFLSKQVYQNASNHFENQAIYLGFNEFESTNKKIELYKFSLLNQTEQSLVSLTIKKVLSALEKSPSIGINSFLNINEKLDKNSKNISLKDLQEIIQKDPLLTAKILSLSNHPDHNPSGKTISAISTAIHMLGFNKIHKLTLDIVQKPQANTANIQQKIAHANAYTSAVIAESLSKSIGHTHYLEDVFIATSLRNTGKILLANILPEEYKQATELIPHLGSQNAFKKIFGIHHEDLGRFILKSGDSLPKAVLENLQAFPATKMGESWQNEREAVQALSESAVEITNFSVNASISAEQFNELLQKTFIKFGIQNFDTDIFKKELRNFANQLEEHSKTKGMEAFLEMASTLRRRSLNKEIEPVPFYHTGLDTKLKKTHKKVELANEISVLVAKMANPSIKAQEFNREAIQIITRNTGFKNAVLFLENASYGHFVTSYATGNLPNLAEVTINIHNKSIFSACMEKDKELFIKDAKDQRFNKYLPQWILNKRPASVLIIPIKDMGKPKGFLCATSDLESNISELDIRQVRALRILLAIYRRMEMDHNNQETNITRLKMAVA